MNNPVEELARLMELAGIDVARAGGAPEFIVTFGRLSTAEQAEAFAELVCDAMHSPEWRSSGLPGFYETQLWKRVRYLALARNGNRCQCCGASPATGAVLHVDHIKPRSLHPRLAFSIENLQVLCADCNIGKSNKDETDWRPKR